ncbi:MAG: hypothetical protein KAV87_33360 [Desulfobacteraceae bacterium]|nr:hypothetical protein [Desulfobacteraceae bacterium]
MADSINTFKPVEITLRTGESYQVSDTTVKLLAARTKWTVSGDSALVVRLEVENKKEKEILYLTRTSDISQSDWGTIKISLLNGDNGLVNLIISPR